MATDDEVAADYEWTITVGDVVAALPLAANFALLSAPGVSGVTILRRRAR